MASGGATEDMFAGEEFEENEAARVDSGPSQALACCMVTTSQ